MWPPAGEKETHCSPEAKCLAFSRPMGNWALLPEDLLVVRGGRQKRVWESCPVLKCSSGEKQPTPKAQVHLPVLGRDRELEIRVPQALAILQSPFGHSHLVSPHREDLLYRPYMSSTPSSLVAPYGELGSSELGCTEDSKPCR